MKATETLLDFETQYGFSGTGELSTLPFNRIAATTRMMGLGHVLRVRLRARRTPDVIPGRGARGSAKERGVRNSSEDYARGKLLRDGISPWYEGVVSGCGETWLKSEFRAHGSNDGVAKSGRGDSVCSGHYRRYWTWRQVGHRCLVAHLWAI
jgi:hypothetical protein